MAIAFSNLGSSANPDINDNTNNTSYNNSSWTPPTSGIIVVFVQYRPAAVPIVHPTISGNNLTWTQIKTLDTGSINHALAIYATNASGSTEGATTFTFSSTQTHFVASFFQVTGADLSGGLAAAFVQTPTDTGTGTSGSVTLAAAGNANNRPIVGFIHREEEPTTPDGDWTELDDLAGGGPVRGVETQYRDDAFDTQATASWTTSSAWGAIAAEIKADVGGDLSISESDGLTIGESVSVSRISPFSIDISESITVEETTTVSTGEIAAQYHIPLQNVAYEVWLCDQYGSRLQLLDNLLSFDIVRVANDVGYGSFTLPGNFDQLNLGLDHIVEVWRAPIHGSLQIENAFFLRKFEFEEDNQGNDIIVVGGPDGVDLLNRRIVAYASMSAQAYKNSGDVGHVMLDIINENLASAATNSDRDITDIGFSVGSDKSVGVSLSSEQAKGFAWKPLIRPLQEFANWLAGQNRFTYFTIEPRITSDGNIGFESLVRSGEIFIDHTYEEDSPIIFSKEWGNLSDPRLVYDYTQEVNYVYSGGAGEQSERNIAEAQEAARVSASIWNRREAFVDSRNDPENAIHRARERLREGEPKVRFTANLLDTPQLRYGRDWHFGDRVIAAYQGRQFECIVKAVSIKVDKDGRENIKVKVESLITSFAPGQSEDLP